MEQRAIKWKNVNKHEIVSKGSAIYEKIKAKLEPEHLDEVVVIEVDSGEYFLGKDEFEADEKARQRYPNKVFYMARVGHRAMYHFHTRGSRT